MNAIPVIPTAQLDADPHGVIRNYRGHTLPGLQLLGNPPRLHGHSGLRRIDGMQVGW